MNKNVFICGGHVTPAIALIDELSKNKDLTLVYIGRKNEAEYDLITEKRIRFLPIVAGKRSWSNFLKIPVGFIQAFGFCIQTRPDIIVSFGGYVALPVAIAGWFLHVPVITHEQTLFLGFANRIIARIAKRVCVTHKETLRQFPSAVVTGLPFRSQLFTSVKSHEYHIDEKKYPLIYITGGSQGAVSLNEKIMPAVPELTKSFTIIHQTGPMTYKNSNRYMPERHISVSKLSWILQHAMIVIGRSGANTTMELAALGKVAVLVPLPWSADNEQLLLARWLADRGGARVIEQDTLTPEMIISTVKNIRENFAILHTRAETLSRSIPRDGTRRLANEVYALL